MKDKERILFFCVSFEARTNSIHLLKNRWYRGWRKDGNVVDIFQRLRGIIYVLLSELCAKDSTTVEGITPSTLKISTESSVNSGARNQESGCKHRERERHQLHIRGVQTRKLYQLVTSFTRVSTNFYTASLTRSLYKHGIQRSKEILSPFEILRDTYKSWRGMEEGIFRNDRCDDKNS